MFDNNYLFPFDTGLSHLSHSSHQSQPSQPSHSSHNRPCGSHPPLAQACRLYPIQNLEFKIYNFYSSCPIQNSEFKIHNFLCRLHYTYHIQTIQEERTKSEKSAKYKHLIKVPKVVCFTFQLF